MLVTNYLRELTIVCTRLLIRLCKTAVKVTLQSSLFKNVVNFGMKRQKKS